MSTCPYGKAKRTHTCTHTLTHMHTRAHAPRSKKSLVIQTPLEHVKGFLAEPPVGRSFTPTKGIKIKQNVNKWTRRIGIGDKVASGSPSGVEGIAMTLSDSVCIFGQKTKTAGTPTKKNPKQQEKQQKTYLYGVDVKEKLKGPWASSLLPDQAPGPRPALPDYP